MPEGHEDHSVFGMLQEDGSFRPLHCETCHVMWFWS